MSVVLAVSMDSRADAEELEASLRKYADERIEVGTLLERKRDTVILVAGLGPRVDRKVLSKALWDALSVAPGKAKAG